MFFKWYLDQLFVENLASVKYCDIKVVLSVPIQCALTIRQKLSLTLLITFCCLIWAKLKQFQKLVLLCPNDCPSVSQPGVQWGKKFTLFQFVLLCCMFTLRILQPSYILHNIVWFCTSSIHSSLTLNKNAITENNFIVPICPTFP